ncbi:MAG: hypothetical protein KKC72_18190, partial [Alphaproteobacteria bacterium]|nr:hypothetical protein [Alphaproteobacteria bacterium]MBU1837095.1 hypothetical protein [Alphaproteobacteria bacterium]
HGIQDRFLWEMYALEVNYRSAPLVRHLCRKITAASSDPTKVKKFCDRTLFDHLNYPAFGKMVLSHLFSF